MTTGDFGPTLQMRYESATAHKDQSRKCPSPVTNGDCSGPFDDRAAARRLMSTNAGRWCLAHHGEACRVAVGGRCKCAREPPLGLRQRHYWPTANRPPAGTRANASWLCYSCCALLPACPSLSGAQSSFSSGRTRFPGRDARLPRGGAAASHLSASPSGGHGAPGVTLAAPSALHWLPLAHGTVPQTNPAV